MLHLTSARDLLRLQVERQQNTVDIIVANPDFGEAVLASTSTRTTVTPVDIIKKHDKPSPKTKSPLPATAPNQSVSINQMYFSRLPGTDAEAKGIRKLLPSAMSLTGELATETAIKNIKHPRLLHITCRSVGL